MWKKRNDYKTIAEYVIHNTGQSIEEYMLMPECEIENLDKGTELLHKHVGKPVYVLADYDVDGISSGYEMFLGCSAAGLLPHIRFPKRFSEGYGFSDKILEEILNTTDPCLVILVDNGITAIHQVKKLKENGYDVLIIDHHVAKNGYPCADVIIDQSDGLKDTHKYGYTPYCAAALTLRFFEKYDARYACLDEKIHNTMKVMAGIATVADVVPMINGNRKITKEALEIMNDYNSYELSAGVKTLLCGVRQEHFTTTTIGFNIAPMLNAPGRLEDRGALLSATLLASKDEAHAKVHFEKIRNYNEIRKRKSTEQLKLALDIMKEKNMIKDDKCRCKFIVVADEGFDKGICGIIAGKLCEKYNRPAIVMNITDGVAHGSARSTDGINLVKTLNNISDCFLGYGGHAKAAGMSANAENVDIINDRLNDMDLPVNDITDCYYDFEVREADFDAFIAEMEKYTPFGEGNPIPSVYVKNYALYPNGNSYARYMGENDIHVKLFGANSNVVAFGLSKEYKDLGEPINISVIGQLSDNYFDGKIKAQIEAKKIKPYEKENIFSGALNVLLADL